MSNQADHTIVRLRVPPELKQKIEESAEKNNRSQSAEMVARIEQSFDDGYTLKINEMYNQIYNEQLGKVIQQITAGLITSMLDQGIPTDKVNEVALNYVNNMTNKKAP